MLNHHTPKPISKEWEEVIRERFFLKGDRLYRRVHSDTREVTKTDCNGYVDASACLRGETRHFRAHHIVWFLYTGNWPDGPIDHINRIRNDNRPCNLRVTDSRGNARNRKSNKKMQCIREQCGSFFGQVWKDGKLYRTGISSVIADAQLFLDCLLEQIGLERMYPHAYSEHEFSDAISTGRWSLDFQQQKPPKAGCSSNGRKGCAYISPYRGGHRPFITRKGIKYYSPKKMSLDKARAFVDALLMFFGEEPIYFKEGSSGRKESMQILEEKPWSTCIRGAREKHDTCKQHSPDNSKNRKTTSCVKSQSPHRRSTNSTTTQIHAYEE